MFLESPQTSQENTCASLFFNKVAGLACNCIKKEALAQVFSCEVCEISKNTFCYRTPLVTVSGYSKLSRNRSSHWRCFIKKLCLKILHYSRENIWQNLFFKVAFHLTTLSRKRLWYKHFLVNFSRFFTRHVRAINV